MGANVFSKGMMAVAVTAVVLGLGACGVKSSPRFPEGSGYPREYPYAGPKQGPSAPSAPSGVKAEETERGRLSPLGFPLEYPNRPSY